MTSPDYSQVCFNVAYSNDVEKVISSFIHMNYKLRACGEDVKVFQSLISSLSEDRLEELITMDVQIMRHCMDLIEIKYTEIPVYLLSTIGTKISSDPTSVESIVSTVLRNRWPLTKQLAGIITESYQGWKFLHRFNFTKTLRSKKILSLILKKYNNNDPFLSLLSDNGSALEYLMYIDQSLPLTIASINRFALWDSILSNPAAKPIIDYGLENFHLIENGKFYSRKELWKWIAPMISKGALVNEYITIADVRAKLISPAFFSNPNAIDLIAEWATSKNANNMIIDGLITIACCENERSATKAVDVLDDNICDTEEMITQVFNTHNIVSMLQSTHARTYANHLLFFDEFEYIVDDILFQSGLVPYWLFSHDGEGLYRGKLLNLNSKTVKNMDLDIGFRYATQENVHLLSYNNWRVLLKTQFGVDLAIENIGYVIDTGLLFELLGSPLLTKEMLFDLRDHTDTFDYAEDDEFVALLSRSDLYYTDLNKVYQAKKSICQDVLREWHDPSRIIRFASAANMDMRSYLQIV